jgi:hypothetical protein
MKRGNKLYIAYGSNMNLSQMAGRCPNAKHKGVGELEDYRLLFRGGYKSAVATVEPYKGASVPIVLWELTPADEASLDHYEGFPFLYRKEKVKVKMNDKEVSAMIYIMNDEMPVGYPRLLGLPSSYYYSVIFEGYKSAGIDTEILRKATIDSAKGAAFFLNNYERQV